MSYSSSKQVSHMASLYESIYSQVLTEEQEIKLSIIECYNALLNEGIIDGDLIQNNIALDEGKTTEFLKLLGRGLTQATGVMTQPTTKAGRITRSVQQVTVPTGTAAVATNQGDIRDRLAGAARGFAADPKKKNQLQSFDVFDVIKGHLLDEGYADTEESALKIMANMSQEWKQSILSEDPVQDYRDMKRADENRGGARGPELSHNTTPGLKGKPQPGRGSVTQKSTIRGREFTNPPS